MTFVTVSYGVSSTGRLSDKDVATGGGSTHVNEGDRVGNRWNVTDTGVGLRV